jgi:pentatricopeptide repeat protein
MHLESLLNYVAFNRKEQQRTFLPDEDTAPPPPPPNKKTATATEKEVDGATGLSFSGGASEEKVNLEAQMVLRGALNFKRVDVVMDLYNQLRDSNVGITESTFTLMIEACVQASDLKKASDFLMKMETSGYNPESQLIDKVMALYSQQKSKPAPAPSGKEKGVAKDELPAPTPVVELPPVIPSQAPEEVLAGAGIELVNEQRQKLSSHASIFVPSFIPPPPPSSTKPKPAAAGVASEGPEGAEAAGEKNVEKKNEDDTAASQRTRLTATAKEFLPQFNVTFDPYMYTWTVDQSDETAGMAGEGRGSKKGAAKAKAKAKVKAKAKAKAAATGDDVPKESKNVKETKDDKDDSDGKAKAKAKAKTSAKA